MKIVIPAPMIPPSRVADTIAPANTDLPTLSLSHVELYLVHELVLSFSAMWMTSLKFPAMFSQTIVWTANVQTLPLLGTAVQVTVV